VAGALAAAAIAVVTCAAAANPGPPVPRPTGTASPAGIAGSAPATVPRLIVPDIIAGAPGSVTPADLARLRKLSHVMAVLPVDGARIQVNGKMLTVAAAPADALRRWMPPATAANNWLWHGFTAGQLITTAAEARTLRLTAGAAYPVVAAVQTTITFGGTALLGITGVDAIVNQATASRLGLVKNVAVLINAPAADMTRLAAQVKGILGAGSKAVRLVPAITGTHLPVDLNAPTGRPESYLALFQESAAQYCPGLSWTVLAAIGQIESGDGANTGPSTAGALGPMQFLPSTWKIWGIDAFGETGPPDIMNPFDAVPSAALLLCANGAAQGGQGLRQAIFAYNHATWYVDEVLTLAGEYAREFG
jgi:hypothetical protein